MIDEIEIQKGFFHPICTRDEIERIFNVRDGNDYLLKIRAETIVDHMRLFRVYRNKALANEGNWSLEGSFDSSHFNEFVSNLDEKNMNDCKKIYYGNIFSNDPNGFVFKSSYGPLITISESLTFFFKFMNLALLNFDIDVPTNIRFNSLRIAIRVMLKTEALDFLMDPRGILPISVSEAISAPISNQMLFIAGHEFAHYLLGHLSDKNTVTKSIFFAISSKDESYKNITVYNTSQKQELEADVKSIVLPRYNQNKMKDVFEAALLWFAYLHLYEAVCESICPSIPWRNNSHPTAIARYENLLLSVPTPNNFDIKLWKDLKNKIESVKNALLEDVSINIDAYEKYGSAYLDKPNTKWRGPQLVDRVDYY